MKIQGSDPKLVVLPVKCNVFSGTSKPEDTQSQFAEYVWGYTNYLLKNWGYPVSNLQINDITFDTERRWKQKRKSAGFNIRDGRFKNDNSRFPTHDSRPTWSVVRGLNWQKFKKYKLVITVLGTHLYIYTSTKNI